MAGSRSLELHGDLPPGWQGSFLGALTGQSIGSWDCDQHSYGALVPPEPQGMFLIVDFKNWTGMGDVRGTQEALLYLLEPEDALSSCYIFLPKKPGFLLFKTWERQVHRPQRRFFQRPGWQSSEMLHLSRPVSHTHARTSLWHPPARGLSQAGLAVMSSPARPPGTTWLPLASAPCCSVTCHSTVTDVPADPHLPLKPVY